MTRNRFAILHRPATPSFTGQVFLSQYRAIEALDPELLDRPG
jgi:hypothetical protein